MKIELTIATGKQFENCHASAEFETLEECLDFAEQAEEKFHNCFVEKDIKESANIDTSKDEILNL
jgi:hypothetical protein